tara:strand:+ start:847 stop:984 length:138 start_codon:yes stop_codon:yes gene_type:complete
VFGVKDDNCANKIIISKNKLADREYISKCDRFRFGGPYGPSYELF